MQYIRDEDVLQEMGLTMLEGHESSCASVLRAKQLYHGAPGFG